MIYFLIYLYILPVTCAQLTKDLKVSFIKTKLYQSIEFFYQNVKSPNTTMRTEGSLKPRNMFTVRFDASAHLY